jgi:hypothetical protein
MVQSNARRTFRAHKSCSAEIRTSHSSEFVSSDVQIGKQPDISKMLRGDFRHFSVERLLRFLVALGQDVEIVIKPHWDRRRGAQLRVA